MLWFCTSFVEETFKMDSAPAPPVPSAIMCCAISMLSFTFVFAVLDSTHCQYLECVCACDRSKAILGDSLHIDLEWPKVVFANIDLEWPDSFICFISESSPPYHI